MRSACVPDVAQNFATHAAPANAFDLSEPVINKIGALLRIKIIGFILLLLPKHQPRKNMENPIAKLALNYWYKVLIAGGFFVFLVNGTGILTAYPTAGTGLISLGCALWGVGEWINHPYQEVLIPGVFGRPSGKLSGYPRKVSLAGIAFDVIGGALIVFGIVKLFQ
ncbi:hypothetical protein DJ138_14470 [Salmonella enterica]|nr:hypothetical protein [Salmonella enterica subsp. enterica serovar Kisangani]EAA3644381.1 hypothetical protein [Salmonella enterica subsp. enterica serovar Weltevreden]EAA5679855.1 hypothetical protein [Salmonella enterica subsp. enterica]EAO7877854.1 hypothetical protein [Salmonella enterica]EBH8124722.1 hypothetical protein [Salmonella enterica subsp. enterica serovar Typhimurium str. UK-1]